MNNKIKHILKKCMPNGLQMRLGKLLFEYRCNKMNHLKIEPYISGYYPRGVNLIGDIKAETGLGQSCRLIAGLLDKINIAFDVFQIDQPGNLSRSELEWDDRIVENVKYDINIIHINPNIWPKVFTNLNSEIYNKHYNIAFWLWELDEFPEEWLPCIRCVDEIWTPSEFISNSIRKKTRKRVETIPYYIRIDSKDKYSRNFFGLPEDRFLFLMMYDVKSIEERKNPRGVIEAYKKAFKKEEKDVGLVIKVNHLECADELLEIKELLHGYDNIYFLTRNMNNTEVHALIKCADVFVSLHRAEGFGLTLAEAMLLGTPVIATNWSAPTEFMVEDATCLVEYNLILLDKAIGPYPNGSQWAEPNLEQASGYMFRLKNDNSYYNVKSKNGKEFIENVLNFDRISGLIKDRINEIHTAI